MVISIYFQKFKTVVFLRFIYELKDKSIKTNFSGSDVKSGSHFCFS